MTILPKQPKKTSAHGFSARSDRYGVQDRGSRGRSPAMLDTLGHGPSSIPGGGSGQSSQQQQGGGGLVSGNSSHPLDNSSSSLSPAPIQVQQQVGGGQMGGASGGNAAIGACGTGARQHAAGKASRKQQGGSSTASPSAGGIVGGQLSPAYEAKSPHGEHHYHHRGGNVHHQASTSSSNPVIGKGGALSRGDRILKGREGPKEAKEEEDRNSDDEYGESTWNSNDELELRFAERLKKQRGLIIKEVKGDGACMFRAVADQIYGDEEMHGDVRHHCMEYIAKNRDHFSQFLTEDFDEYLARKRLEEAHGNHVELQAISEIYARPIEIYEYSIHPINIFHPVSPEANATLGTTPQERNAPLRLSYHGTVHYNSVIDPYTATIGVGLGLPGFQPGLAERNLLRDATLASEAQQIEEAMLSDKLRMTDWERTDQELVKEAAKRSYMDYLHHLEGDTGSSIPSEDTEYTEGSEQRFRHETLDGEPEAPSLKLAAGGSGVMMPLRAAGNPTKKPMVGVLKRGASSSPNIPCCSRDSQRLADVMIGENCRSSGGSDPASIFSSNGGLCPVAKMQRDEHYSSSMPNIDLTSTSSWTLGSPAKQTKENDDVEKKPGETETLKQEDTSHTEEAAMKPSTSTAHLVSLGAGDGLSDNQQPSSSKPSAGLSLYEELLATSALAYFDDDWAASGGTMAPSSMQQNENAMLAQAIALSQQEFYESMKQQSPPSKKQ